MAKHSTSFRFSDSRVVRVKFTEPNTLWESPDGDSRHTRSTCRLPAGLTKKEKEGILQCIAYQWSTFCEHGHDCCGHWYRSCRAVIVGRRLTLTTYHHRNV